MVAADFSSKIVFLDTAPLIYFIEGSSSYQNVLSQIFLLNEKGRSAFISTTITLLEVLVKPLKEGKPEIAQQYRDLLTKASGFTLVDVTTVIAERAALLRASYNLKTPDSIQVAAAIESGCDIFLTNDRRLNAITEIRIVTMQELE